VLGSAALQDKCGLREIQVTPAIEKARGEAAMTTGPSRSEEYRRTIIRSYRKVSELLYER